MKDIHAVAISPDKTHLVLKRGEHYTVIDRREGLVKGETKWRDKKLVSQMIIKGGYQRFKKPVRYKGLGDMKKSKAVARLDEPLNPKAKKKKDKDQDLVVSLGLQNFRKDVQKSKELYIDLEKADNSHLPKDAERFSYNCNENYNIVYIPVNRLKEVYQTKEALNPATINRKAKEMKSGKAMPPVYIGYDYDVHDGHHSWNAAMKNGYTHVPCKVVGSDPDKVKQAIENYKKVWKSEEPNVLQSQNSPKLVIEEKPLESISEPIETPETSAIGKAIDLALVLDLAKAVLNRGKLVKRSVQVRGKNGKVFTRMQWVDPNDKSVQGNHPGVDHSTYAHHTEGLKEMEKRQSNRFPVVHHPTSGLSHSQHNYNTDKKALAEAEEKYKRGEKLPPIHINPHGDVLEGHHLLDLAKKHGLSHVPAIVIGNPNLKKQLEDKLKDRVIMEDENGEKTDLTAKHPNQGAESETVTDLNQFLNFTKKKYTKQYLMSEAERQGITWDKNTKGGEPLPQNSKIMWMRAHQAIVNHIKDGKTFEVLHDEKDVDKRMQQDGKDSIHKHFLKLLEKHGSKDDLMEWARKSGVKWKEVQDPDINWLRAVVAMKQELAKGRMLDGVRTRQKGAMAGANLVVSPEIKDMVKTLGKRYGKANVMQRADELGISYDKYTKKGDELPQNSSILWMRAHEAISRHIAEGNNFKMGDEQDNGITAEVGEYGGVKLSHWESYAVDTAKRKSQNREAKSRKWAIKSLMLDKGVDENTANGLYDKFMQKARDARVMVHFDPLEMLPSGVSLLDQISSEGTLKNDFLLNRGFDRERRESDENYAFGDDFSEAGDEERPIYGVVDLYNQGLKSHPYAGEVAMVLNHDTKQRVTGTYIDSGSIEYGKEGQYLRSMTDPHQLLADRWTARWKQPKNADKQRERAFDSVLNGKEYKDDNQYFESHIHGGLDISRDVNHILVPGSWMDDPSHKEKHSKILDFAKLHNIPVKYEGREGL